MSTNTGVEAKAMERESEEEAEAVEQDREMVARPDVETVEEAESRNIPSPASMAGFLGLATDNARALDRLPLDER